MMKTGQRRPAINQENLARIQEQLQSRLVGIVASAPCVIFELRQKADGAFSFPYCSPGIEELFGLTPRELEIDGAPAFRLVQLEDQERLLRAIQDSARGPSAWRVEFRVRNPYRGELWVEGQAQPRREPDGTTLWHGCFLEISLRKRAETETRQNMALYRAAVECTADGILAVSEQGAILSANTRFLELWKLPSALLEAGSDDLILNHVLEQLEEPEPFLQRVQELYESDKHSLDTLHFKDGRVFERYSHPLSSEGQRLGRLWGFRDITESHRAIEALRRSEALLRAICEGSCNPIVVKDLQSRLVVANPAALRVYGKPASAVLGKPHQEVFNDARTEQESLKSDKRVMESGCPEVFEECLRTPDGPRVFLWAKSPRRDSNGRVIGLIGVARDITQRKRMEDALRQSAANLAAAQRIAGLGSWELAVVSADPLILDPLIWSDEVFRIYGLDPQTAEMSEEQFFKMVPREDRERIQEATREAILRREPYELEHRIVRADGVERIVQHQVEIVCDASGQPLKLVGTLQDITERRRGEETQRQLEAKLRQSQKMEAVGQLAGGVAHDFNNLLTVILGNSELLAQAPGATTERQEFTRQISAAARRAANLTRQLLAFSRQQVMQVQQLDLNAVLANVYKMLYRLLGEHIALRCNYAADLPPLEGDAGMIEQVIMNLAINARDAMPRGGGLGIATRFQRVDSTAIARNAEAREGDFIVLEVADTGCGMDSATLARVFEPFFTTKDVGKGTGLGLATVYGIVKQHRGWLEVTSEVGRGTTFKVFLPAVQVAPATAAISAGSVPALVGGQETILLVEDEPAVRQLAQACLSQLGYRVLEASSGPEAVSIWAERWESIDLILTDLVMPEGMNGHELAQHLRRTKPSLKAIYSSGYSRDIIGPDYGLEPGEYFLPKPVPNSPRLRVWSAAASTAISGETRIRISRRACRHFRRLDNSRAASLLQPA